MDLFEPQLIVKKEVRFTEAFTESTSNGDENFGDVFGGIIKSGQWGWLTKGSKLRIMSIRTGQVITKFDFDDSNGFGVCIITCVSEVSLPFLADAVIAIGLQYVDAPGSIIALYSVEESAVLKCIELKHKITCCKFISHAMSQHTVMQNMNGCLAVGTDGGNVLLVDLNLHGDELNSSVMDAGPSVVPCHIVDHSMSVLHLHRHFQHCQQEGVHFGIQLEGLENADFVQSLLPIDIILGLAVGLGDGRLVLYDLTDMLVFYVVPPQERSSPLVKMSFMEPPDDPRPCVYIWAFHENYQNSKAVLHSLMYEKRIVTDDGFCYFENFQVSSVRLQLPLNSPKSVPVTCQTIFKPPSYGNEDTISLCALVWKHEKEMQTEVLLFDINQWYKEEMPYVGDWREEPSYLASFVLPGMNIVEFYLNSKTTSMFNSIQRSEEHFYPVSLSFDCVALGEAGCFHLNWPGVQNRVINFLRSKGSLALLDPNPVFVEILNTKLLPQFSKLNYKSTFSLQAKRETLLSVALEQNCIGLLKDCAKSWSDGSHRGPSLQEALTLSTLTDWLWSRATSIKDRCNSLCQVLFNHSGFVLDQREQKELGYISKQLKTLAELLDEIVTKYKQNIPSDVLSTLQTQSKSIQLASDYQEILLWLLNIGLLPEASRRAKYREIELNLVPYPYESLQRFYTNRRMDFTRLNEKFSSRKTRSCYLLFIDSFIEHEFKGNSLRDSWQETGGDGLYPPTSIQAMLRTMLSPDVSFENKCALFLYFFLDLNMAIEDKRYEPIVQNFIKFPSVFKLSASLIKQIQAFWNLDHCRFPAAVDEFISPFNKDHICPQWQLELFIESLLAQSEANLALRVLEAKSSPISPVLQLNTYLANDLISEAFHFARSKQDEDLLKLFFTGCLCTGKFGVIRDLALTESEGALVQSILKNSKSRNAENLHFVYLLQKYKYIEAVSYLDELSKSRAVQRAVDVDTPTLVLSAYNTTMTPVTKGLSDVYFKIKNKIKSREAEQNSPYPLSCQLIKQNANDLLGGIYQSSALSTHFASQYWERHHTESNALQQSKNAPFLRRPQVQASYSELSQKNISYPDPYMAAQKRRLEQNSPEEDRTSKVRENPKKRRKVYDLSNLDAIYKPLRDMSSSDSLLTSARSEARQIGSQTKYQKSPPRDTSVLLDTPFFKKTLEENADLADGQASEKRAISLQSILKATQKSSTEETDQARGGSVESDRRERREAEEEKSIRFVLPAIEDESDEQMDVQESVTEVSVEKDQSERESSVRRYSGPSKRKSLRSISSSDRELRSNSPMKTVRSSQEPREPAKRSVYVEEDSGNSSIIQSTTSVTVESLEQDHAGIASEDPFLKKELTKAPSVEKMETEKPKLLSGSLARPAIARSRTPLRATKPVDTAELSSKISSGISVTTFASSGSLTTSSKSKTRVEEEAPQQPAPAASDERVVPTMLVDEKQQSTKRALSESSDDQATESLQRGANQPKGRGSIHSSSSESGEQRESAKDVPQRTETMYGFEPHMSSSRVILSAESRFKQLDADSSKVTVTTETKTTRETFAERSTVVGGLTYLPSLEASEQVTETISMTTQSKQRLLDTTVDMTMYDTMAFEHSNPSPSSDSSSNMGDEPDDDKYLVEEEESSSSGFNAPNEYVSRNDDDDGDSVILLSSRSSSATDYGDALGDSKANGSTTVGHIIIDDEDDDDEENHLLDVIEGYSSSSDHRSNSYSNQFSEVTRTSTSCSMQSNPVPIDVDADVEFRSTNTSYKDVEEAEDYEDVTTEFVFRDREQVHGDDVMESLAVDEDSDEEPRETTSRTVPVSQKQIEINVVEVRAEEKIPGESNVESEIKPEKSSVETAGKKEKPTSEISIVVEKQDEEIPEKSRDKKITQESDQQDKAAPLQIEKKEDKNTTLEKEITAEKQDDTVKEQKEAETLEPASDVQIEVEKGSSSKQDDAMEVVPEEKIAEILQEEKVSEKMEEMQALEVKQAKESVPEKVNDPEPLKSENTSKEAVAENPEPLETENTSDEAVSEKAKDPEPLKSAKKVEQHTDKSEEKAKISDDSEKPLSPSTEKPSEESVPVTPTKISTSKFTFNEANESGTPTTGRRRSSSFSKVTTTASDAMDSPHSRRNSRSGSMPPSSAGQIVTRRRSMLLEKLEEHPTPDSPSTRTRSKLRLDSIDSEVDSPSVSSVKRTRRSSISSVTSVDNPSTPKSRRRNSTSVDKELTNTPKTPRSIRGRSVAADEASTPIKTPRRLSTSKRDKSSPTQSIVEDEHPETSRTDDLMASRRLTRTQLAALEKSAALEKQFAQSPIRVTRRRMSKASEKESPPDVKGSDTESISSRTSHLSNASRRITRSSVLKETTDDDVRSVASSTESGNRKRRRGKEATSPIALSAIPEEDASGSEKSLPMSDKSKKAKRKKN